jgi:hypothetical protein
MLLAVEHGLHFPGQPLVDPDNDLTRLRVQIPAPDLIDNFLDVVVEGVGLHRARAP